MGSYVLPADRSTAWNLAGTTIPSPRTVYTTLGASPTLAQIQAALDACPVGQEVRLVAGTTSFTGNNYLSISKGVTLRGAGAGLTIIQKTDGAHADTEAVGATPTPIILVGAQRWYGPGNATWSSVALSADATKGAYSVTVSSAAGFAVGQIVLLDEMSGAAWQTDPCGRGLVLASPDWRVTYQLHSPGQGTDDPIAFNSGTGVIGNGSDAASWFCRQDRPTCEWKKIASINGTTITFTTPVHISYRTSHTAQLTRIGNSGAIFHVQGAGIEDLSVLGGDNGQIRFEAAAGCWAQNVDSSVWHDEGWAINNSHGITLRGCNTHDAAWAQPGGAGYALSLSNGTADCLIENSIFARANKVMVSRCAGAGSVFGYNYADQGYINTNGAWIECGLNASHMVGPHHVLFEGNYGFNADSDKTHGSAILHTFFRNHLRGRRSSFTNPHGGATIDDAAQTGNGPRRCAGLGTYSYWHSFVGNVLGAAGELAAYEGTFSGGGSKAWMLGWDDWNPYPVDAQVAATTLRDGNFDHFTGTVSWHGVGVARSTTPPADATLPDSLYLSAKPAFMGGLSWPWVTPEGSTKTATLPAKARFDAGTPNDTTPPGITVTYPTATTWEATVTPGATYTVSDGTDSVSVVVPPEGGRRSSTTTPNAVATARRSSSARPVAIGKSRRSAGAQLRATLVLRAVATSIGASVTSATTTVHLDGYTYGSRRSSTTRPAARATGLRPGTAQPTAVARARRSAVAAPAASTAATTRRSASVGLWPSLRLRAVATSGGIASAPFFVTVSLSGYGGSALRSALVNPVGPGTQRRSGAAAGNASQARRRAATAAPAPQVGTARRPGTAAPSATVATARRGATSTPVGSGQGRRSTTAAGRATATQRRSTSTSAAPGAPATGADRRSATSTPVSIAGRRSTTAAPSLTFARRAGKTSPQATGSAQRSSTTAAAAQDQARRSGKASPGAVVTSRRSAITTGRGQDATASAGRRSTSTNATAAQAWVRARLQAAAPRVTLQAAAPRVRLVAQRRF